MRAGTAKGWWRLTGPATPDGEAMAFLRLEHGRIAEVTAIDRPTQALARWLFRRHRKGSPCPDGFRWSRDEGRFPLRR